jgi:hypothetical protein
MQVIYVHNEYKIYAVFDCRYVSIVLASVT